LHEALVPVNIVKVRVLAAALPLLRKGVGRPELGDNIPLVGFMVETPGAIWPLGGGNRLLSKKCAPKLLPVWPIAGDDVWLSIVCTSR
jgi:hypothetical protein